MRLKDLVFLKLVCLVALISTIAILSAAEGLSKMEVRTDRPSYLAGETATVTLRTHPADPADVYVVLTTPSGLQLYADPALQFRRWRVAAATNYVLAEGKVDVPLSLATSKLARPGEYKIQIYLSPPGGSLEAGELAGTANFLVTLPGLNYLALHNPDSPRYDDDCAACHVDKTRNVSLAPGVPSFHTIKYRMFSAGGLSKSCAISVCHNGADLLDFSQAALRKQASPDFCAQCHGAFATGKRLFAK
jgi:hypothetical protein